MQYGISTHLFHDWRLGREHLSEIAAQGFEAIELFATHTHFDYRDARAIGALGEWLEETGLRLHSVHAPVAMGLTQGRWEGALTNATSNPERRQAAIREATAALELARTIPFRYLVVHLGLTGEQAGARGENRPELARRSLEELRAAAEPLGVQLAVEVIPNSLSGPGALVDLIDEDLDARGVGICLDFGHALLLGDPVDALETVAGHLVTTHVHDNHGRSDDHLVPFDGRIEWSAVLMTMRKIGYEGILMFEVANGGGAPRTVLERTRRAREQFDVFLTQ